MECDPILIDGSQGEGGGQILRTSLALAIITGRAVRFERIRAGRPKPGLQRQHLAAVRAAARVGCAQLSGDELGSRDLSFAPQLPVAGEHRFDIGSAGSTALVLQTVLPPLLLAAGRSRVVVDGGTHNPLAPTFEFLRDSFLPVLARIGARVALTLERHGFHPAGGGRLVAEIEPLDAPVSLELRERGRPTARRAVATVANLPDHVAEREAEAVKHALHWGRDECMTERVAADGPGNAVTITLGYAAVTETIVELGSMRVRAEEVARKACAQARRYLSSEAPVGEHLADQLLLPLALAAGGVFRTLPPTPHTVTNAAVIARFLGERVAMREDGDAWEVTVTGGRPVGAAPASG